MYKLVQVKLNKKMRNVILKQQKCFVYGFSFTFC